MMRKLGIATGLAVGLLALAACGGRGDDALGENVESAFDNRAEALEAQADNLEAQAENLRDEGDRKEDAIDDSDVDTTQLNAADKARIANTM